MHNYLLTILLIVNHVIVAYSQCPSAGFTNKSSACLNEQITLQNLTPESDITYQWDFCEGDLGLIPEGSTFQTISDANNPRGLDLISDGDEWYAFVTSRSSNALFRISFGQDLNNGTPVIENLGNVDGEFDNPENVKIFEENGNWHGLVYNSGSTEIVRLDFANGLQSDIEDITATSVVASVGGTNSRLTIANQINNIVVFLTSFSGNTITQIDFGSSILNVPMPADIQETSSITNALLDIELFKFCDDWYGLTVSYLNRTAYLLEFGNSLLNDPNPILIADNTNFGTALLSDISLLVDLGEYNFLLSTQEGEIFKLNIGTTPSSPVISIESLGDFGLLSFIWANDFAKQDSEWIGFSLSFTSRTLTKITFPNNCSATPETSSIEEPNINYGTPGNYQIELKATDLNGNVSYATEAILITTDVAPLISLEIDASRCISASNTFTPSITGLTSYSWDFDGDGFEDSDEENPEVKFDTLGGVGTYTVRLDVSDGTCNNFFEQEITIYDPPPMPAYMFTSPRTCINTDFSFTNNTIDGSYEGPLEYLWEFIDEPSGDVVATATTRDAVYAFETEGEKTVRLTSSIPGCSEVTEQTLMITPGPSAIFSASSVCQNEAMLFSNNSSDAVSYEWDFGDGFMSTAENPSHVYTEAGNFSVTLVATDIEGCDDTEIVEVSVADSPQVNFDFDVPCTSSEGIQFSDLTTVEGADLVSWTWFVDDVEVSSLQNPAILFESTGIKNIRLNVESSNGCETSYSEDIEVLTSPEPDFLISLGCQGEISTFTDNTATSGNPIVSWLWTVDGVNYATQDISHVFNSSGSFEVSLEVTGQNFCSEISTKMIEITQLPSVDFNVNGDCDNEIILVQDLSTQSSDPIVSRRWMLDGVSVGNGSQLFLDNLEDATYELELELETASGCTISESQILEINEAPLAAFNATRTYGIPNDQFTFTNNSTGAISYEWLINNVPVSTNSQLYTAVFADEGVQEVNLVAQNSLGCYDTATQEIIIAVPEVDLSIGDFELVQENQTGRIFLEVQNNSNLPVEVTEAEIMLENSFSVTEQIVEFIDVGESRLVNLNVGIPLSISEPAYFCVTLTSQYVDYPDLTPLNNEKCLNIQPKIQVEDPFPNPVVDRFRMKIVTPEAGVVVLRLIDSAGKVKKMETYDSIEGLNNFFIDMSLLNSGLYFVSIEVMDTTFRRKVIKL